MHLEVSGEVVEWRGPAPHHFVVMDDASSDVVREVAGALTYGWGVVPVVCHLRQTRFTTSLFPRQGRYWIPLKDAARTPNGVQLGDVVTIEVDLDV